MNQWTGPRISCLIDHAETKESWGLICDISLTGELLWEFLTFSNSRLQNLWVRMSWVLGNVWLESPNPWKSTLQEVPVIVNIMTVKNEQKHGFVLCLGEVMKHQGCKTSGDTRSQAPTVHLCDPESVSLHIALEVCCSPHHSPSSSRNDKEGNNSVRTFLECSLSHGVMMSTENITLSRETWCESRAGVNTTAGSTFKF